MVNKNKMLAIFPPTPTPRSSCSEAPMKEIAEKAKMVAMSPPGVKIQDQILANCLNAHRPPLTLTILAVLRQFNASAKGLIPLAIPEE